jgi:hypothetical protein
MDQSQLLIMTGQWTGVGTMTVGSNVGDVVEYLRLDHTDFTTCLSYMRNSRITFGARVSLHNELGYMRTTDASLLLSRGSYVILPWDPTQNAYVQAAGSPDSRNMKREVIFEPNDQMVWHNSMEVNVQGTWVTHIVHSTFTSITNKAAGVPEAVSVDIWQFQK